MKKFLVIFLLLISVYLLYWVIRTGYVADNKKSRMTEVYKKFKLQLPDSISFAGEEFPIQDMRVRGEFDKILYKHIYPVTHTYQIHQRAGRWLPMIERILKRYKIPSDFKYLALVESKLSNEISGKGAAGFWQLVPSTAVKYGLAINSQIDERYNIEKSTEAVCKYLHEMHRILKNWTLVAAAYNLGLGGVIKQTTSQASKNYYDLLLNKETGSFVYKLLAMKEIITRPGEYGYRIKSINIYAPVKTKKIEVDSALIDLHTIAKYYSKSVKGLKQFNPWILGNSITNEQRFCYILSLPAVNDTLLRNFRELIPENERKEKSDTLFQE